MLVKWSAGIKGQAEWFLRICGLRRGRSLKNAWVENAKERDKGPGDILRLCGN